MSADAPAPRLAELFPESAPAGEMLRSRRWPVGVAKSCTGGLLGAALTAVPGSSDYVLGGVIAYANAVKGDLLGVDPDAARPPRRGERGGGGGDGRGGARGLRADVGIGITGVAGPGAEEGKPAGLVFVAIATPDGERVVRLDGDRGREENRAHAVRDRAPPPGGGIVSDASEATGSCRRAPRMMPLSSCPPAVTVGRTSVRCQHLPPSRPAIAAPIPAIPPLMEFLL